MFKYVCALVALFSVNSCKLNKDLAYLENKDSIKLETLDKAKTFLKHIDVSELTKNLRVFASDSMQGRATGTLGQRKAAEFIKETYKRLGISSPGDLDYYQMIPKLYFNKRSENDASNVLAYIEGKEAPDELVIISAHYDHLGIDKEGNIFNGADDNGSGTMAIIEIAKAFKKAVEAGYQPKRSILFLHVSGEEIGLYGSRYYVENPIFPLNQTIVDLNIDMIGRIDEKHCDAPNYLYIIGSDRLSNELHLINDTINEKFCNLDLDYTFNSKNDPNRFYYRSDHYNFAKNNIPVIFYFNGTHDDYHQATDTTDKIEFNLLKKRIDHIFLTAWELSNRKERIKLN